MPTLRSTEGISRIDIEGLKSIGGRLSLDVGKLTILAGANSSGKSTVTPRRFLIWAQGSGVSPSTADLPLDANRLDEVHLDNRNDARSC